MKKALLILFALSVTAIHSAAPKREKGISMHMLPDRIAKFEGKKGGFTVSYAPHLKPEKKEPILRSTEEFKAFIQKQKKAVKENGVWIVTTNPVSYSEEEKALLKEVSTSISEFEALIFVCRGSELPDGWQQTNKTKTKK